MYIPGSFSAGQVPTTALWNQLWANDASFNDGTGIATNAISAPQLASTAIYLGSATSNSNFTTTSASAVQVTSLTTAVTIPAGGRNIKITVNIDAIGTSGAGQITLSLWDGAVGSGTQLKTADFISTGLQVVPATIVSVVTPAAGAKTYSVGLNNAGGIITATAYANATSPALLLIEAI